MMPAVLKRQKKQRKAAPADDGKTQEIINVLVNSLKQNTDREGNVDDYVNETESSTWQVYLSSSSDSDSHFDFDNTEDSFTDLTIPNDNKRSNKMDRIEFSANNLSGITFTRTGRPPIQLYLTCDDDTMSLYQCFVRKQIELFEANTDDTKSNAQGRNKPIILGQVGIRCRYCSCLPPKQRTRGATYYPSKLDGIYQAANNLAFVHLGEHCENIDDHVRTHLTNLRIMVSIGGGGKKIWADRAAALGVYEDLNGLRFEPTINYRRRNYLDF